MRCQPSKELAMIGKYYRTLPTKDVRKAQQQLLDSLLEVAAIVNARNGGGSDRHGRTHPDVRAILDMLTSRKAKENAP